MQWGTLMQSLERLRSAAASPRVVSSL
jgi:hypothetical protein